MKKYICVILVVSALVVRAHAQTTNSKYEVTLFGAPPSGQEVWNLPRSIAADGKGTIFLLRASDPPVLIFNREGKLQKTWGIGLFKEAHSIDLDREGFLWSNVAGTLLGKSKRPVRFSNFPIPAARRTCESRGAGSSSMDQHLRPVIEEHLDLGAIF